MSGCSRRTVSLHQERGNVMKRAILLLTIGALVLGACAAKSTPAPTEPAPTPTDTPESNAPSNHDSGTTFGCPDTIGPNEVCLVGVPRFGLGGCFDGYWLTDISEFAPGSAVSEKTTPETVYVIHLRGFDPTQVIASVPCVGQDGGWSFNQNTIVYGQVVSSESDLGCSPCCDYGRSWAVETNSAALVVSICRSEGYFIVPAE
jgi:hypothetical protein